MIMLLTHQVELREQATEALRHSGYDVAIPLHRNDMIALLKEAHPRLVILDLYLSDPSGAEDLKRLRDAGYEGPIVLLSGPSMMPVLKEAYPRGVTRIVPLPAKINDRFDLGELRSSVHACLSGDVPTRAKERPV